ncbi:MAG: serine hydrolase [Candidatus Lokiarchaeota archaeon]|nr:serine hydrolase [Candidatus Lokiarchaeota archaeon]
MAKNKKILGILAIALLFITAFSSCIILGRAIDYFPMDDDSWTERTLEEGDFNETLIDEMYEYILDESHYIESILISRDGYIVHDQYLEYSKPRDERSYGSFSPTVDLAGMDWTQKIGGMHAMWSVTKSVTSLLTGIAIANGSLDNVSVKFFDIFPDRWDASFQNATELQNITVEHLLTMTSGIMWDEATDGFVEWSKEYNGFNHSISYILNKSLEFDPGTTFEYSTGSTELLACVLQNVTNMLLSDFAWEYLFEPIGIDHGDLMWLEDPWEWGSGSLTNISHGGYGIYMTPRAMARIGELVLNNGSWDGVQVVPKDWIINSSLEHSTPIGIGENAMYGYLWWIRPSSSSDHGVRYFSAVGAFGQKITIVPDYDMVIAITSDTILEPGTEAASPTCIDYMIDNFIIPAVITGWTPPPETPTTPPAGIPGFDLYISIAVIGLISIVLIVRIKSKSN